MPSALRAGTGPLTKSRDRIEPFFGRVGQRRAVLRTGTSVVSAVSGFVANGPQAIHTFPLPPLKFRTVGFPQYGFKRALQVPPFASSRWLWRDYRGVLRRARLVRSRACAQAARSPSDTANPSSGPWLRRRLFCPPASSLTMATSAPLPNFVGLCIIPATHHPAEGPQFTPPELDPVPPSLPR